MATIQEIQDDIIAEFSDFDDWLDRYQLLIDLGGEQEALPDESSTDLFAANVVTTSIHNTLKCCAATKRV